MFTINVSNIEFNEQYKMLKMIKKKVGYPFKNYSCWSYVGYPCTKKKLHWFIY